MNSCQNYILLFYGILNILLGKILYPNVFMWDFIDCLYHMSLIRNNNHHWAHGHSKDIFTVVVYTHLWHHLFKHIRWEKGIWWSYRNSLLGLWLTVFHRWDVVNNKQLPLPLLISHVCLEYLECLFLLGDMSEHRFSAHLLASHDLLEITDFPFL